MYHKDHTPKTETQETTIETTPSPAPQGKKQTRWALVTALAVVAVMLVVGTRFVGEMSANTSEQLMRPTQQQVVDNQVRSWFHNLRGAKTLKAIR